MEHVLSCPNQTFNLQPITGEVLSHATAISDDGARLDFAANGFWGGRFERAFFDVRVFNPHAPSNRQPLPACYRKYENLKKRAYEQRVREIERGSFTPLVSLASQTFARKTGGSGDISMYAFVTLPESGKDQSDHSTDYRVHSKRR